MPVRPTLIVFSASISEAERASAHAVASCLASRGASGPDVRLLDFFEECAPAAAIVGRFAHKTPGDARARAWGTFADLVRLRSEDPLVGALAAEGLERAEKLLSGIEPAAVVSVNDVAGGVSAEVSGGDFVSATVLVDMDPRDRWLHPGADLYFVACQEARDRLVVAGVPLGRIAVSGVPTAPVASGPRAADAGPARRFSVLVAPSGAEADAKHLIRGLADLGVRVSVAAERSKRLANLVAPVREGHPNLILLESADSVAAALADSDVVVCDAGAAIVAQALVAGAAVVVRAGATQGEQPNVDFLVDWGAALSARDDEDVASKVRFLAGHPDRLAQLGARAAALGRPSAAQAVCERVLATIR